MYGVRGLVGGSLTELRGAGVLPGWEKPIPSPSPAPRHQAKVVLVALTL